MTDLYPALRKTTTLHLSPTGFVIADREHHVELCLAEEAGCIFAKCDGTRSISTIATELANEWETDVGEITEFLEDACRRGLVDLLEAPHPSPVRLTGDRGIHFPRVVSLELTTACNIRCIYCYGSHGPEKRVHLAYERVAALFDMLADHGVTAIELTGGEPLVHPRFLDIFRLAFEKFSFVAILSNGILWKPDIFRLLEEHRDRAFVQISIDGSNETTTAQVRQRRGTFDKTIATIRRLVECGVRLRVACVVTKENVADLRASAQLLQDMGVKNFVMTIADGIGRGSRLTYSDGKSLVNFTSPEALNLTEAVAKVGAEFRPIIFNLDRVQAERERLFPGEDIRRNATNCGIGDSIVALRANGDVTGCQYMQDGVANLGNVFRVGMVAAVNNDKARLMREFYKDRNDPACMHCAYNGFCASCMVRIYQANLERRASGHDLCGVARRTRLDQIFDFSAPSLHNVSGCQSRGPGLPSPGSGSRDTPCER